MLRFQISIHSHHEGELGPLAVTFDAVLAALERLPRMFIEPDGSFVWTGATAEGAGWQVDGNLIDRGDVLAYVELKGSCPEERLNALLATMNWPAAKLLFQLSQRGVTVEEADFRKLAVSQSGAI